MSSKDDNELMMVESLDSGGDPGESAVVVASQPTAAPPTAAVATPAETDTAVVEDLEDQQFSPVGPGDDKQQFPSTPGKGSAGETAVEVRLDRNDVMLGQGAHDLNRDDSAGATHYIHVQPPKKDGSGSSNQTATRFSSSKLVVAEGDAVMFRWFVDDAIEEVNNLGQKLADGDHSGEATANGSFLVVFRTKGAVRRFRLKSSPETVCTVTVGDRSTAFEFAAKLGVIAALGAVFVAAAITVLVVWARQEDFLLPGGSDADDSESYKGTKELRDIFITYGLPWVVIAVLVLAVLLCVTAWECCRTIHMQDFGRGYGIREQRRVRVAVGAIAVILSALLLCLWLAVLTTNHGFGEVFGVISASITDSLNEIISVAADVRYLANNLHELDASIVVPPTATATVDEVEALAVTVRTWSTHGNEIMRALFRSISILMFLALNISFYSAALTFTGIVKRRSNTIRKAVRFAALALFSTSLSIGLTWVSHEILIRSADVVEDFSANTLTSEGFQRATGMSEDSAVVQLVGMCFPDSELKSDFLSDIVRQGVAAFNRQLATSVSAQGLRIDEPAAATVTLELLSNYSEYVSLQLQTLEIRLQQDPTGFSDLVPILRENETIVVLRTATSAAKSLLRVLNCEMIRTTLGKALPFLREDVIEPQEVQLGLQISIFALLLIGIVAGVVASHVMDRPRKLWAEPRTNRSFLFRASLKAHQSLLKQHEESGKKNNDKLTKTKWRGLKVTALDVLLSIHAFHTANTFLMATQGLLLVILHNSFKENELNGNIQAVAFFCVAAPVLGTIDWAGLVVGRLLRLISRFTVAAVATAAAILSIVFVVNASLDSKECYEEINERQSSNSTAAYPFTETCQLADVLKDVETGAFLAIIGLTCALTALVGVMLLTCGINTGFRQTDTIFARKAAGMPKWAKILIGAIVLVTAVVVVVFIFVSTASDEGKDYSSFVQGSSGCNGHDFLCSTQINKLVWPTTHNAYSSVDTGFVGPNNYYGLDKQLRAGVRGLMLDVHDEDTSANPRVPALCHGPCAAGKLTLTDELVKMKDFLDEHPNDVVLLILEQYSATADIVRSFAAANLTAMAWAPGSTAAANSSFVFPTLNELIELGQRLIVFTDTRPGSSVNPSPPNWYLYQWDFMFETSYVASNLGDFTCRRTRGVNSTNWGLLNHFLTSPIAAPSLAAAANEESIVKNRWSQCRDAWGGVIPSLIAVDFWSVQNALRTMDDLNIALK